MTRWHALAAIVPHRMRGALRSPLAGYVALITVPTIVSIARGDRDLTPSVSFALLAGGSAFAFMIDDQSRDALTACPRGWTYRHLAGAVVVAGAIACAWLVIVGLIVASDARTDSPSHLIDETAAVAALGLTYAASGRSSTRQVGLGAAIASLMTVFVISGLSTYAPVDWLPVLGVHGHARRWSAVAGLGALLAAWLMRDPASRRAFAHAMDGRILR